MFTIYHNEQEWLLAASWPKKIRTNNSMAGKTGVLE
jgi:hypothetical protein